MNSKTGHLHNHWNIICYLAILLALSLNFSIQLLDVWRKGGMTQFDCFLIMLELVALGSLLRLVLQIAQTHRLLSQNRPLPNHDNAAIQALTRLRKVQSLAQLGDWEFDVITGEIRWSEELFHIFGRDPKQPPPSFEEFFQLIPTEEREHLSTLVQQSLSLGCTFSFDHRIVRPDDTIRYVACRGESIQNEAGEVIRLVGTARDITAQKQLELALHKSEARLNDILNTAIAAISNVRVYRDHTWIFDYISDGAEVVYGYKPAEFLAEPTRWMDILDADDREAVIVPLFETFFSEQQVQIEFRIHRKDGEIRWISSTMVSHRHETEDCWIVTAVNIDISDRKRMEIERQQAEQAVHQQQALLRQVIDSIPHHLFVRDKTGRFCLANRAAAAVHGTTPEQLVGHFEADFNPYLEDDWLAQVAAINQQVMERQEARKLPDSQLISHTGKVRWCQVHLTPYFDVKGELRGIIGNTLDVTDRKQLELALKASERQLSMTLNAARASIISYRMYRDHHWEYLYISSGCEAILGYRAEDIMAEPTLWQSRVVPEDWEKVFLPVLQDIFNGSSLSLEYRFRHKDNTIRWLATELTSVHDAATDTWVVTLVDIDISDRKRAEQELVTLATQERAFNRVVHTIRSSLDLGTIFATTVREAASLLDIGRVGIVQYLAERQCWIHQVDYRSHPEVSNTVGFEIPDANNPFSEQLKRFEVVQIDSTEAISDPVNSAIAEQFPGAWLLIPLVVNSQLWGSLSFLKDPPISPFSNNQVAMAERFANQLTVAIQQSTLYTQLQAANQKLQYLATHDPLTELTNRRYFDDYLERECNRLYRSQDCIWLSLILCDIDYFKHYNDYYGHPKGDECLVKVAQALSRGIRRSVDFVARFGGEEFAIVLPETDEAGAVYLVKQIQAEVETLNLPHASSPISAQVTLSFGVACLHNKQKAEFSQTPQSLLQIADEALYEAKRSGRNRYQIIVADA